MVDPAFPPPQKKKIASTLLDLGDFALHFDLTFFGLVVMVTSLIMTHLKFERSPLKRDYPESPKKERIVLQASLFSGAMVVFRGSTCIYIYR